MVDGFDQNTRDSLGTYIYESASNQLDEKIPY